MSYSHILFERTDDAIALLTINRPQKLNALNRAVIEELDQAFREVAESPGIKGLIITGAGEKAFIAGADISEFSATAPVEMRQLSARGQAVFRRLETMGKPSIAAVNGFALGGGLELAMSCTLRIASPNAKLGQPEVKLGLIPGYGGTQRLPRMIGRGKALELLLTGEPVDAAEALRIGLVNQIAPQDELLVQCRALLKKIFENAPLAVALSMEMVDAGLNCSLEEGLRAESLAFGLAAATQDRSEGAAAFLEKRKPVFTGK
jgi:enoyl-CoA hydratase